MKEGAAVNVLVYPGWKTVPYNQCLYRDMANISFAQYHGAWFPLSRNLTSAHQVLHLHWTEDLFAVNEKNSFKFFVRYLISLIDIFYVRYVKRVPIIWTVHNLYAHNCVHLNADGFIRKLIGKIASVVIVHGERAQKTVASRFRIKPQKIEVIRHGNFMHLYPNIISRQEARKKLGIDESETVYLFFGSVSAYKGPQDLIRAFEELANPSALLIIAGKGAKGLDIPDAGPFSKNIRLYDGYIDDADLQIYMNAADWVVLPYKHILTSASLITAMGYSKAVIIPTMGTLADYTDDKGAIIYNYKQKDSLHSALQKSLTIDAAAAGEYNYKKALRLDWKQIQQQTTNIYKQLING